MGNRRGLTKLKPGKSMLRQVGNWKMQESSMDESNISEPLSQLTLLDSALGSKGELRKSPLLWHTYSMLYKIQFMVLDSKDETCFVLFDSLACKFFRKTAVEMLNELEQLVGCRTDPVRGTSKHLRDQEDVDMVNSLDKEKGVTLEDFKLIKMHMANLTDIVRFPGFLFRRRLFFLWPIAIFSLVAILSHVIYLVIWAVKPNSWSIPDAWWEKLIGFMM
ncbi:hypothetical protein RIF29_24112 [Crotalaria pallida]|uniref:Uncharacterized protein n=1 Tax=Crotalaria pallida TaxID=3830 RepID=A0AAN9HY55_CROPI